MTTYLDHCAYTVDSLRNSKPRGKQNRPWWSRACKRRPLPGGRYCWQHARMVGK